MRIDKLELNNFRCYRHLDMRFHPQLTVLVAVNGEGKTSMLDALRIGFWLFVSQFDLARTGSNDPANTIALDDVRVESDLALALAGGMSRQLPCNVRLQCSFNGQTLDWTRVRKSEASRSKTLDGPGCKKLKALAQGLQESVRDTGVTRLDLPLLGYYGTERLWSLKRKTTGKLSKAGSVSKSTRTFAYQNCLDPASSFRQFEEWFSRAYKSAREQQIKSLEESQPIQLKQTAAYPLISVVQGAVDTVLQSLGWHNLEYSEKYDKALILHHPQQGTLKVSPAQ